MKLCCNFETQNQTVRSDVYLNQEDDCSVVATIIPCTPVNFNVVTEEEAFLTSIPNSSPILLTRTPVFISNSNTKFSSNAGLKQEFDVKISSAELKSTTIPSNKISIKFYLTNIRYFDRSNIDICINGKPRVTLHPFLEGQVTHYAVIDSVNYSDLDNIKDLIDSICWLISFASGKKCCIAKTEVCDSEQIVYQELISVGTKLNENNVSKLVEERDVIKFVEKTYVHYQNYKDTYLLKKLINIGIQAKHNNYTEVKTLLMVNFLEVLRYNFALNVFCRQGIFKKKQDDFIWNKGKYKGKNKKVPFKEIIIKLLIVYRIKNSWHENFKKNRNSIIHKGDCLGANDIDRINNYRKLHHFCDRIMLAILQWDKYSGYYIPNDQISIKPSTYVGINRVLFNRKDTMFD